MPFFVMVRYEARPGRADDLLALIRDDFAASPAAQPGRRFARVFQALDEPAQLLAIEEWQDRAAYEQHAMTPAYVAALAAHGESAPADELERLQHYRHMPRPLTALSCAVLTIPPEQLERAERFVCDDERRDVLDASGLVLRAVYRIAGRPARLVVLHGWRTLDDLRAYTATSAYQMATSLASTGVLVEQFCGQVRAQYSWLEA
jgi:quinol monooxygenase YgiN